MVNILISTDTRYPVNRKVIRQAVADTFNVNKIAELPAEVSVSVVGSRKMKMLSDTYIKDNLNHEVLSFPMEEVTSSHAFVNPPDDILRLGDVILCWPKVVECAAGDDVMVDEELYKLTVHGVEHLLGKHHG